MASSSFIPKKRPRMCALSENEKTIILNVHDALHHQNPKNGVTSIVEMCSNMTGVGVSAIYNLLRERKNGPIKSPKKSSGRKSIVIEAVVKQQIRRTVHSFYMNKEIPTLEKLLFRIQTENICEISKNKLWKILQEMNFRWEKHNRNSLLIERDDIVLWRRRYLKLIKDFRRNNKDIYYLDETWLNEGYTVTKVWQDKNIKSSRQAFLEGLSTGFHSPSGKGRRLIITHIGSTNGFLKEGLLEFESKNTGDYHEDMNSDVFEEYFEQMVEFVPRGAVIVMDNASYHSRKIEKLPNASWRKNEIIEWLIKKNINFEEPTLKKELLHLANLHKDRFVKYAVEEIAEKRGITILRLPPYHCELNPIEMIWSQVKGFVARKNTSFKLSDVKVYLKEAITQVTADSWRECIEHVKKEEEKMWQLDNIIEDLAELQPIIITPNDLDDTDTDFSDL